MTQFMTPRDPDAFVDFPKKDISPLCEILGNTIECPQCLARGGWNLQVNAYPMHSRADTPENRHKFAHFRCLCNVCNGHGYVREDQNNHNPECIENGHGWKFDSNLGKCYNRYKCVICGIFQDVDSSD